MFTRSDSYGVAGGNSPRRSKQIFQDAVSYYCAIYNFVYQVVSSLHVSRPKYCTHALSHLSVPSLHLIVHRVMGLKYLIRSYNCELLRRVIFSALLSFLSCRAKHFPRCVLDTCFTRTYNNK